jgi:hypothetical protein
MTGNREDEIQSGEGLSESDIATRAAQKLFMYFLLRLVVKRSTLTVLKRQAAVYDTRRK